MITKKDVANFLKQNKQDDIREVIENSMTYNRSSEIESEVVFHKFTWDGSADSFQMVGSQIAQTELLLASPELSWISNIINNCYVFYDEYGLSHVDNLILVINGSHFVKVNNTKQNGLGRSLTIHYSAIRDNIATIRQSQQLNSIRSWNKYNFLGILILLGYFSHKHLLKLGFL